jgi:hypothetical protein
MSLSAGDQATIIGVGLAGVLAFGAGVWRAASLRGDVNARWAARVDFAVAALDEKTIRHLEALRDEVGAVLPEGEFDPAQAIADPAPLSRTAERAVSLHRTRIRMQSAIAGLMRIGRAVIGGLTGMLLGTACATAHYAELWDWAPLEPVGLILLGASAVFLLGVAARYVVLQDRLASAENLAGTAGKAEQTSG